MTFHPDRPVLVAVDFSEDSRAAFDWATDLARRLGLRVVVLHVAHDSEETPGIYQAEDSDEPRLPLAEAAQARLDTFMERRLEEDPELASGPEMDALCVSGIPETRVLEVAAEVGAQMIVAGSRGRTGLQRLLLGSKASRIAQLSPIPVTIVKARRSVGGE